MFTPTRSPRRSRRPVAARAVRPAGDPRSPWVDTGPRAGPAADLAAATCSPSASASGSTSPPPAASRSWLACPRSGWASDHRRRGRLQGPTSGCAASGRCRSNAQPGEALALPYQAATSSACCWPAPRAGRSTSSWPNGSSSRSAWPTPASTSQPAGTGAACGGAHFTDPGTGDCAPSRRPAATGSLERAAGVPSRGAAGSCRRSTTSCASPACCWTGGERGHDRIVQGARWRR